MPRRTDIESICVIGSGPIVIGQACEFDYAGCQALKVLREEGYRTIVCNSNPATIMTDPGFADRTYIEPLDLESVASVLRRERPDALLPTLGGQTALNLAIELAEDGVLDELGVELIGAPVDVIRRAEDRQLFRDAVRSCGLEVPSSQIVTSLSQLADVQVPAVVRPAFTLGGHGGGFAEDRATLAYQVERGLWESPIGQVLVEESVRGWDEFELEVMRDRADNVVIVCSIENLDPMGVHTGDSVTVAPQMTLSDEAYQELRDAAAAIIRAVGVETGGSNIQFARSRETGELRVIEMNPRVSRSSALASKATGYPIAKVAAKLAVGYTLDEIPNDLTKTTPASFEPTLDYVVVKFPRFAFEKFPGADQTLGTQMKSVGEAMGIGRTFSEALLKAHGSRELERGAPTPWPSLADEDLPEGLHPWFREEIAKARAELASGDIARAKRAGWGDDTLGEALGLSGAEVRRLRHEQGIRPSFRRVDSCAGEVEAASNYFYSTWGEDDEAPPSGDKPRVVILGSGPNRIGQGIEFDYCCVHAAQTFRALGYEAVMVNCNPETVSTDYDTSDRLYFEPLSPEEVLAVCDREQPVGVVTQFGGQTPLRLARSIEEGGYAILGTPHEAIDLAEDRERFGLLAEELGIRCPPWAIVSNLSEALAAVSRDRLPGARAALLRPRRPRDARLLRRGPARGGDGGRQRQRPAGPLRRERDRARRGRALRRRGRVHRRRHAARRGGRRALGRLGLRAACAVADARCSARGRAHREAPRAGTRRGRHPQRPARDRRLDGLRARGESACVAHRPLREQGDRREPRRCRLSARRRRNVARARSAGATTDSGEREGRGAARSRASPARIPCSGRRCARRARSWRVPPISRPRSRRRSAPPVGRFRRPARRSCPCGTRTSRPRSPSQPPSPGSASSSSRPRARHARCAPPASRSTRSRRWRTPTTRRRPWSTSCAAGAATSSSTRRREAVHAPTAISSGKPRSSRACRA